MRMKRMTAAGFLIVSVLASCALSGLGQVPGTLAAISGTVIADREGVRAVRVKANDTVHRIAYTEKRSASREDGGLR